MTASAAVKREYAAALAEKVRRKQHQGLIHTLYPDTGPTRRELYGKHLEAFRAGTECMIRIVQSGTGVGKTTMGGYEITAHLTGLYPDWWPGHRYDHPTKWWAAGKSSEDVRNSIQQVLFGEPGSEGTGMIPGDLIEDIKWRSNKCVDYAVIKHVAGGKSYIGLKSYDQDEPAFRAANRDGIWLDEPCPYGIFDECVARLRSSDYPMLMLTYTPMDGITPLVLELEKPSPERRLITISWDDVPHLTEAWKATQLNGCPEHLRETRRSGVAPIGEGAVFPVDLDSILCDPLPSIPDHWPRLCGFDGGWHNTAGIWGALDKDSDTLYLYSEHKAGQQPIAVHAAALKARGDWIPVVGDAAAINQTDGVSLLDEYKSHGVRIHLADKHEKSRSIQMVLERMLTGRLKVYRNLQQWIFELRAYRYEDGKIVKENDHLMDGTQYLCRGLRRAKTKLETTARRPLIPEMKFGRPI